MKKEQLEKANNLSSKIERCKKDLEIANKALMELSEGGDLGLELEIRANGLVRRTCYKTVDHEFDYILGRIKSRYEKELFELQSQFDSI